MIESFRDFLDDVVPEEARSFANRIKLSPPLPLSTSVMVEHEVMVNGVTHKRFVGAIASIAERRKFPIKKYFYQIEPINLEIRGMLDAPLWVEDSQVRRIDDEI